jgi:hypothetical protein
MFGWVRRPALSVGIETTSTKCQDWFVHRGQTSVFPRR